MPGEQWYRSAVRHVILAVIAMIVPLAHHAAADEGWRTVAVYNGQATIEIPSHWHEISADVLEFLSLRTAELTGGRITETYQAGFRPAESDVGFDLPQILIQIRESGRLKHGQFRRLPSPTEVNEFSGEALTDHSGPFVQDFHLADLSFDQDRMCLLVTNTIDLAIEGPTTVESASFLTEHGVFVVHGYDLTDRMTTSGELFDRVIASVRLADGLAYQSRWTDSWSSRHSSILFFILAAIAAAVAFYVHRIETSRSDREIEP